MEIILAALAPVVAVIVAHKIAFGVIMTVLIALSVLASEYDENARNAGNGEEGES